MKNNKKKYIYICLKYLIYIVGFLNIITVSFSYLFFHI